MNQLFRRLAGGCHLNRPINQLVADCGLELTQMDNYYMEGPKPFGLICAGLGVPRLVTQTPDIDSGYTTSGEAVGCRDEDGAPAATDVEYMLVASEIEFIEQLLPDRQFARTGAVEVARSDSEHGYDPHLRQRADKALVSSLRPPVTSQKTGFDRSKYGMPRYPRSMPYLARSRLTSLSLPATAADHL